MHQALGRAELVLVPSRYEGFGLAAVESMAAGAPVVVSATTPLRDHVEHGVSGFVAPFEEPAAAARTLRWAMGQDLAAVGMAARRAVAHHDWGVRATEFGDAYRALLDAV